MKSLYKMLAGMFFLAGATPAALASIVVPDDFPGSFSMNLIVGAFAVDSSLAPASPVGVWDLDVTNRNILFSGSAFDGSGLGAGTSNLTVDLSNHIIATAPSVFGVPATFFIDGGGGGTLVDNETSTAGHWTMTVPLYADWNGLIHDLGNITLSTDNSISYWVNPGFPIEQTATGNIMNYQTGDAVFVGQTTVQSGPFVGLRISLEFLGNDPPVPVPVPAAIWFFGSGLLSLVGIAKKAKAA
jgi:hypothetical protein